MPNSERGNYSSTFGDNFNQNGDTIYLSKQAMSRTIREVEL